MIVSSSRPREIITFSWSAYKEQRIPAFVDGRALTRNFFRTPASRRLGEIGAIIDHPTTSLSIAMHTTIFINPRTTIFINPLE
jgi:hypothetical protein